ncbi:hypothetical protein GCM10009582_10240 [Arthrobacter flavus]
MNFRFFKRGQPIKVANVPAHEPGIPDHGRAAFSEIIARAQQLFGAAVETGSLTVGAGHLPWLTVGALSIAGEQWIVVDVKKHSDSLHPIRLELDWEDGVKEAIAVLEVYQYRKLLAPTPGDVLTARVIALVGDAGNVTMSMIQEEFSHVIAVRPHREGAVPFNLSVTTGFVVVLEGSRLGWWTFGGDYDNDGVSEAFEVVEHLVLHGGTIHSTRHSSKLLDSDGITVSGPHRDGVRTRHTQTAEYLPYRAQ